MMKKMNGKIMPIAIFLILAVFYLGHKNGFAQSVPKYGGMLTVGLNTDITAVDPHITSAMITTIVLSHVFEPLVAYGEKMEIVPVLAERWNVSPDLKTYTFYLHKGKLFQNGREMVAEDVKYSIERIMDPNTRNPRRSNFAKISRIEVVDNYTVRFHLKETDACFLDVLGDTSPIIAIVPKEEVKKQGGILKHPIGTGPYKFVEYKPDQYVLLERFEQYKSQPGPMDGIGGERIAYLDKIKFVPIPEESVALMALLNKEIDFLQFISFANVERFRKDYAKRGIILDQVTGLSYYWIMFGCDKPITKNIKFRQACAYAIDREMIANAATRGYSVVNSSMFAVTNKYRTPLHDKWYKKDVAKAKQLLKECGYNGEEIPILTTKQYAMMYDQSVAVQSELAAAGINAKLEVIDWGLLLEKWYKKDFQIISMGTAGRPDPVMAYDTLSSSRFEVEFPRIEEIKAKGRKTLDFEARKSLFEEAQSLVYNGVPAIAFYNYDIFNAYWNYVKGYKIYCTNQPRFWGVWLNK